MFSGYKVPKKSELYPIACHGYSLRGALYAWRLNGARADLLEELKALGFNSDTISFSQRDLTRLLQGLKWFHATFGYKERVKMTGKKDTRLPDDHPTLPKLQLGKLLHRAKKWNKKVGFSDADRKELEDFSSWHSVYQPTVYPLMEIYFKLNRNLDIPEAFKISSCSPWPTWSWQQAWVIVS